MGKDKSRDNDKKFPYFAFLTFLISLLGLTIGIFTLAVLFANGIINKESFNFIKVPSFTQSEEKEQYDESIIGDDSDKTTLREKSELLKARAMLIKAKLEMQSKKGAGSAREWVDEAAKALENLNIRAKDKFSGLKDEGHDLLESFNKENLKEIKAKTSQLIDKINIITDRSDRSSKVDGAEEIDQEEASE